MATPAAALALGLLSAQPRTGPVLVGRTADDRDARDHGRHRDFATTFRCTGPAAVVISASPAAAASQSCDHTALPGRVSRSAAIGGLATTALTLALLLPGWGELPHRDWQAQHADAIAPPNPRVSPLWHVRSLTLMVHGNHDIEDFSDPGYAYLGGTESFASRGSLRPESHRRTPPAADVSAFWSTGSRSAHMPGVRS